MLRKWLCQADVKIVLEPVDPVLIKSGYATMDGPDMVPVSTWQNGEGTYYLPGTSLKGVLRSQLERIARTLQPQSVCLPYYRKDDGSVPVEEERQSFGCGFRSRGRSDTSAEKYSDACVACRMFGSLKFGGRFSIGDALPMTGHSPVLELRNGVGIDRFTGGTHKGALYDLQVLVGGKFEADIRLRNFELWQLAALNLLLMDLADELITVGSGRSRGLGRVRGTVSRYQLTYVRQTDHLAGLYQLVTPEEQEAYGLHAWTPGTSIPLPEPGMRGLRRQHDVTGDWSDRFQILAPAVENFLEWHGGPRGSVARGER